METGFNVRSIRRLTADKNHNAFTGAAWFRGELYVAFRQGDAHVCPQGRLVVLRSRDDGVSFDSVAVIRGVYDTRDAHLYTNGDRLFVAGFEATPDGPRAGAAWSDDGLHWSAWTPYSGTEGYVMWRPCCHKNRFFCAGYRFRKGEADSQVAWFESSDGTCWEEKRTIHAGADLPNECAFDFMDDGTVVMLMRRGIVSKKPLLLRALPPYETWDNVELDVPLHGPALWLVGEEIWISGRWFLPSGVTHLGVFSVENDKPKLQLVLPSGPDRDQSYMGVARHPLNKRRFALSYYSGHTAGDDPNVSQWSHPDIYLADIVFASEFIHEWQVSDLIEDAHLGAETFDQASKWKSVTANNESGSGYGFVNASERIAKRPGVIIFRTQIEAGPTDAALLHLGYDGAIIARVNGKVVHEGAATNPALPDLATVPITFNHGANVLEIALGTQGGQACGIFARWEAAQPRKNDEATLLEERA